MEVGEKSGGGKERGGGPEDLIELTLVEGLRINIFGGQMEQHPTLNTHPKEGKTYN